ncbi:MAG: cytidine deaminase [Flavobacteriaceae bacterium]
MKKLKIECNINVFESLDELPKNIQKLMHHAQEARLKAHAPYSNFLVGAALELSNGEIISGNNQENAAYPSGLCAERTAIFYAHSKFPKEKILRMAITAGSKNKKETTPIPPCGGCRQALVEYEQLQDNSIELYFMGSDGRIAHSSSVENILPWVFDKSVL